jgi:hypothetical protein
MTQTTAQNILINNKANNRKTNYGKHPLTTFADLDESIKNNITYINILKKLDILEATYNNTLDELEILISDCRQVNLLLQDEKDLLNLINTYTYVVPNKAPFITFINTINNLIEECNSIIKTIVNSTVNNVNIYTNQIILNDISSSIYALLSKEWLTNYITNSPLIPKSKKVNSVLICNNNGEIVWQ